MGMALVVEDDLEIRNLFAEALETADFTVLRASSVGEAIALLEKQTPDIAFVDMNMPGRLGTEVLEFIRNTPRLAKTHTIVVTANAQIEQRAESLGAELFLIKPVSIREMLTLARRLMAEKD